MVDVLEVASVFPGLASASLRLLALAAEEVPIPAGTCLFREGDPGDSFFIVRSGALEVLLGMGTPDQQSLATLAAGELVGEMAMLYGSPRSATVRAKADSVVVRFPAARVAPLLAEDPSLRAGMIDAAERRLPRLYLASVPIFAGLDADGLRELDLSANWMRLAGGEVLFREGETADCLYVLVRGRLEIVAVRPGGTEEVTGQLGRGAVVGEVALLGGQPRSATVRAIRDSELVRLSHAALKRLIGRHPDSALEMLRVLAGRVTPAPAPPRNTLISTIAVVPVGSEPLPPDWTGRLVDALSRVGGPTLHVTRARVDEELGEGTVATLGDQASRRRVAGWLHAREDQCRYVVFDCDRTLNPWAELCLRQADLVILVASAQGEPVASELHSRIFPAAAGERAASVELVLLHPGTTGRPAGTARWIAAFPVGRHHHVRLDRAADHARVARFITGTCVGVAFSGGGARALGHIGVVRALQDSGIPIDAVAGVSAGCFASGFCAMGHDPSAMMAIANDSIGRYNALFEATLPIVSFLSAHTSLRMFHEMFDAEIEDLWIPFFCLSSNLTRAEVVVHDRGPLWRAIRASTSVPGVSPPVCKGGELLVDGGVLNNLPADVMRTRCGGTVIAVDVSLAVDLRVDAADIDSLSGWPLAWSRVNPFAKAPALPHIFEILLRTATLSSVHHGATVARNADLYMRLPVEGVATLDWKAGPALVERCYTFAMNEVQRWKSSGASTR
jgi:NTE family protein/lysophospholipid hydrolase